MGGAGGLFRTCRYCGNEFKVSRPACPNCGKPPFSRRRAYALAGPRLLALIAFFFFLVLALYGFLLSAPAFERHRPLFFGLSQTASQIVGTIGAVLFLGVMIHVFFRKS